MCAGILRWCNKREGLSGYVFAILGTGWCLFLGDSYDSFSACDCDKCGTRECDHRTGKCHCHENIVGEKCDRCADNHYGFTTCQVRYFLTFNAKKFGITYFFNNLSTNFQGCRACHCDAASHSLQCDDTTGHCRCKDGVIGRTCDRCAAGYWKYTENGCTCSYSSRIRKFSDFVTENHRCIGY